MKQSIELSFKELIFLSLQSNIFQQLDETSASPIASLSIEFEKDTINTSNYFSYVNEMLNEFKKEYEKDPHPFDKKFKEYSRLISNLREPKMKEKVIQMNPRLQKELRFLYPIQSDVEIFTKKIIQKLNRQLQGQGEIEQLNIENGEILLKVAHRSNKMQELIDKKLENYLGYFEIEVMMFMVCDRDLFSFLSKKYDFSFYEIELESDKGNKTIFTEEELLEMLQNGRIKRFQQEDEYGDYFVFIRKKKSQKGQSLEQIAQICLNERLDKSISPTQDNHNLLKQLLNNSNLEEIIGKKYDFIIKIEEDQITIIGKQEGINVMNNILSDLNKIKQEIIYKKKSQIEEYKQELEEIIKQLKDSLPVKLQLGEFKIKANNSISYPEEELDSFSQNEQVPISIMYFKSTSGPSLNDLKNQIMDIFTETEETIEVQSNIEDQLLNYLEKCKIQYKELDKGGNQKIIIKTNIKRQKKYQELIQEFKRNQKIKISFDFQKQIYLRLIYEKKQEELQQIIAENQMLIFFEEEDQQSPIRNVIVPSSKEKEANNSLSDLLQSVKDTVTSINYPISMKDLSLFSQHSISKMKEYAKNNKQGGFLQDSQDALNYYLSEYVVEFKNSLLDLQRDIVFKENNHFYLTVEKGISVNENSKVEASSSHKIQISLNSICESSLEDQLISFLIGTHNSHIFFNHQLKSHAEFLKLALERKNHITNLLFSDNNENQASWMSFEELSSRQELLQNELLVLEVKQTDSNEDEKCTLNLIGEKVIDTYFKNICGEKYRLKLFEELSKLVEKALLSTQVAIFIQEEQILIEYIDNFLNIFKQKGLSSSLGKIMIFTTRASDNEEDVDKCQKFTKRVFSKFKDNSQIEKDNKESFNYFSKNQWLCGAKEKDPTYQTIQFSDKVTSIIELSYQNYLLLGSDILDQTTEDKPNYYIIDPQQKTNENKGEVLIDYKNKEVSIVQLGFCFSIQTFYRLYPNLQPVLERIKGFVQEKPITLHIRQDSSNPLLINSLTFVDPIYQIDFKSKKLSRLNINLKSDKQSEMITILNQIKVEEKEEKETQCFLTYDFKNNTIEENPKMYLQLLVEKNEELKIKQELNGFFNNRKDALNSANMEQKIYYKKVPYFNEIHKKNINKSIKVNDFTIIEDNTAASIMTISSSSNTKLKGFYETEVKQFIWFSKSQWDQIANDMNEQAKIIKSDTFSLTELHPNLVQFISSEFKWSMQGYQGLFFQVNHEKNSSRIIEVYQKIEEKKQKQSPAAQQFQKEFYERAEIQYQQPFKLVFIDLATPQDKQRKIQPVGEVLQNYFDNKDKTLNAKYQQTQFQDISTPFLTMPTDNSLNILVCLQKKESTIDLEILPLLYLIFIPSSGKQ